MEADGDSGRRRGATGRGQLGQRDTGTTESQKDSEASEGDEGSRAGRRAVCAADRRKRSSRQALAFLPESNGST